MSATYKDYYEILGVDRKATETEIKSAYRKAARKYHPDLHAKRDKAAYEEKFKEINEAYAVLGDVEKRAQYDRLGENLHNGQEWQPSPDMGNYENQTWREADADGFSDFFETLFGRARSGAPFSGFKPTRNQRGQNLESELELTLEEAYHGGRKTLQLSFHTLCPACGGSGLVNQVTCQICGGAGRKTIIKTLDVKIPPYVRDGSKIRLKGQGSEEADQIAAGDLLLTVKILPHACLTLNGTSLETTAKVRPEQAVLGCQILVPSIDGEVLIKIPSMTHNNQKLRLRSKGWQDKNGNRGDEYVKVVIDIPRTMSLEEKEIYQHLAELRNEVHKR
ncbi:MAG: J domain-containing protein [Clostridiaceae bacterium]|nr:J domain-containing protein [Clostridiaceae bacterium]